MTDEPHEVVKILLARMESHPEEFKRTAEPYYDRWQRCIDTINSFGNEADTAAINAGMRSIRLAEVHEQVMDELLNGEDRRRKQEEEAEYERKLATQTKLGQYANQASNYSNANQALHQYQNAMLGSGIQNTYSSQGLITTASEPHPTLPTSTTSWIKKALGI